MIRFFTNYSYGGYEELYLGNITEKEEYKYHLPLLGVKKVRLEETPNDEKLNKEVERLSQYPLILKHGVNDESTLPDGVFTHISNPGFKTLYRRLDDYYVVIVSDVVGNDHDEMGGGQRENPFTMLIVGGREDVSTLDAFVWNMIDKETEMRSFLGNLFDYDPIANGLRFSLKEMKDKLNSFKYIKITTIDHSADVPLLMLADGFDLNYTLEIQKLQQSKFGCIYNSSGTVLKGKKIKTETQSSGNQLIENAAVVTIDNINANGKYVDNQQDSDISNEGLFAFYSKLPKKNRITIICAMVLSFILGALIF